MTVSIITINYNNLSGLKSTRESIVSQQFRDWEWIVIDGGSTAGDRDYIAEHQGEMSFWCSEKDKGVYNAMNKGIAHAQGDYLIFMNSGDRFYDSEVLTHVFSTPQNDDVLYGDWVQQHADGSTRLMNAPHEFSLYFICTDNICHQAMFLKRTRMEQSPYDETFQLYADWAKWIDWTLKGYTFKYIPYTVCSYEMGGMSFTQQQLIDTEYNILHTEVIPASVERTIEEMKRLHVMHPLGLEADRLIKKKPFYRKIIHMAIRIAHVFE